MRIGCFEVTDHKLRSWIRLDQYSLGGYLLGILQGCFAVALLATSAWLISRASQMPNLVHLSIAIVGVRAFAVGRAGVRYFERLVQHDDAFRFLAEIRARLIRRMIRLTPVGLTDISAGAAVKRFVDDVDELQNLSLRVAGPLIQALSVNAISALFLTFLVPAAGLALLLLGTLSVVGGFYLGFRVVRNAQLLSAESRESLAQLATSYTENHEALSSFGWKDFFERELMEHDRRINRAAHLISFRSGISAASFQVMTTISVIVLAALAGSAVALGRLDETWLAVLALIPLALFDVIGSARSTGSAWYKVSQSRGRVIDVLERPSPFEDDVLQSAERKSSTNSPDSQIEFQSLEFKSGMLGYQSSPAPVVSNLNLRVSKGESWSFTGPSGAGKSTTALTMLRLIPLLGGALLLNGRPISEFEEQQIRRTIGFVEQVPSIFSGSIRQNLLIANPKATDEELIAALESVSLWSAFSDRGGLDMEVGEFGSLISGGEAQRIALARAVIARFPLVILDEPTANLDQGTARILIEDAIALTRSTQSALVLITHDLDLAKLPTYEVAFGTNSTAIQIR